MRTSRLGLVGILGITGLGCTPASRLETAPAREETHAALEPNVSREAPAEQAAAEHVAEGAEAEANTFGAPADTSLIEANRGPSGRLPERSEAVRPVIPHRNDERDDQGEDARMKAIGAVYKVELRRLESERRGAELAVQSAVAALDTARERPKLTVGEPVVSWPPQFWCGTEDPVEIASSAPDPAAIVAEAEERLAQARAELKRARDAEDDLFTKMRRERIPLSYVL